MLWCQSAACQAELSPHHFRFGIGSIPLPRGHPFQQNPLRRSQPKATEGDARARGELYGSSALRLIQKRTIKNDTSARRQQRRGPGEHAVIDDPTRGRSVFYMAGRTLAFGVCAKMHCPRTGTDPRRQVTRQNRLASAGNPANRNQRRCCPVQRRDGLRQIKPCFFGRDPVLAGRLICLQQDHRPDCRANGHEQRQSGQVNGLTVTSSGLFGFGLPVRITARVRMGTGKVIDIEREVKLGGPIHSKGVLILSSYLATHYAGEVPLSLWASLVFEQSYGGIEGDSASVAELCALLSALAGIPTSQSLAITGSINQMGEVQPIGGVNEKIEGFFDTCKAAGLTGQQGVLIPRRNVRNLMLRHDVIEAVSKGQLRIYAIAHVDEAMELLTGLAAGKRSGNGDFEDGSVNANVETRLRDFAYALRDFMRPLDMDQGIASDE